MEDRQIERFNELWNDFLGGLPLPLVMTRVMLCVLFLLEELQDHGRDSLRVLEGWMADFERSKREESEDDC